MVPTVFHFDTCRLDTAIRELRRAGTRVELAPKVFDCIAYLVEHRDRAVGRDELVAAVWGKTSVTDAVFGKTLLKARRAVGDNGVDQRFIRTIPRFGFHWVAEVREDTPDVSGAGTPGNDAGMVPGDDPDRSRRLPTSLLAVLAAAGIGAVLTAVLFMASAYLPAPPSISRTMEAEHHETRPPVPATDLIAVLPAKVEAGQEDAWLRLGVMDLVANRLRDAGLAVMPSDNVVRFFDASKDAGPTSIREFAATTRFVQPFLDRSDGQWQVRLELSGADGTARDFEGRGGDAIGTAREVADQMLDALGKPQPWNPDDDLGFTTLLQRTHAAMLAGHATRAMALLDAAPDALKTRIEWRLHKAEVEYRAGRIDVAFQQFSSLRDEVGGESSAAVRARILYGLGSSARILNESEVAGSAFDEAIALLEHAQDPQLLGRTHSARGVHYAALGRYHEASDDFSQARTILALTGDAYALSMAEYLQGTMESSRGRPATALPIYELAAKRFERLGAINELAHALVNLTVAHLNLLQPIDALDASEQAIALLERLENPRTRHIVQFARASALQAVGNTLAAASLLSELTRKLDTRHEAMNAGHVAADLAYINLDAGRHEVAWQQARHAVDILVDPHSAPIRAFGWRLLIHSLLGLERQQEATDEVRKLTAWAATTDEPSATLHAQLANAEQAGIERRPDDAERHYEEALQTAEREGVPSDLYEVADSYGRFLIAQGNLRRAGTVLGRVARFAEQDFGSALLQVHLYHALRQDDAWQNALSRATALAGERSIPIELTIPPPGTPLIGTRDRTVE